MAVGACLALAGWMPASGMAGSFYAQTNLVTDKQALAPAPFTDPHLVNPWGVSYSSGSAFWVSDNGTGLATLYNTSGTPQGLVVTIPGFGGAQGNPTGNVLNPTAGSSSFNGDSFLFVSEDGTISGWRGALGTNAEVLQTGADANVYKGAALGSTGGHAYLYAANFRAGTIDVLKDDPATPSLPGSFTDPGLPAGYAPFGIQEIGGKVYVTYALQDMDGHDDVHGPGHGFVDVFGTDGVFLQRLISQGPLNSPWGLALAPSGFGPFGGDLLVGNFGDSKVNAFDPTTGTFLGTLSDAHGNPLVLTAGASSVGLWGLIFGNGGDGGDPNTLYFTSGINDEADGLFGQVEAVTAVPEPASIALLALGGMGLAGYAWRRKLLLLSVA
jgi:uncharacterized protein (TIGR03118 family)